MTRDRYLSDEELRRFLAAVSERRHKNRDRDYALFALLSTTGVRPSEALALTLGDLHLRGKAPWIRIRRLKKRGHHQRVNELVIPSSLCATLAAYVGQLDLGGDARLFAITRRQAQRLWHHYARKANIRGKTKLYILRHTAATRIYVATRDIKLVQALLGHESPQITTIYAHIPRELLATTMSGFPIVV